MEKARAAVILCAFALAPTCPVRAATMAVTLLDRDGHGFADAVIEIRPLEQAQPSAAPISAVMDQVNLQFRPEVLVVPVGSNVAFPNSDHTRHQVYSFSAARKFQLPLYRGKPYPPLVFPTPGIVTLGCNIHDEMVAYIRVTDAPYYGQTDNDGHWRAILPAGHYRLQLWHPRIRDDSGSLARDFVLETNDEMTLSLRLARSVLPPPPEGNVAWAY
ncbi:MAG: methylamine utilization protein [Steroidobacteraceae bacterium]